MSENFRVGYAEKSKGMGGLGSEQRRKPSRMDTQMVWESTLECAGGKTTVRATIPQTALAPNDCGCENFMVRDANRILKRTGRSVSELIWILLFHE